ncbi:hypothetical protein I5Q34_23445 [Streptomyces sp. AV19]|nr:hypothetical protein [Streptomyces sp. AV19]
MTNTDPTRPINTETVVFTAPSGTRLTNGYACISWRSNGGDVYEEYPGTLTSNDTVSTCSGVSVNLAPNESLVLYTQIVIESGASLGSYSVRVGLGSPEFATGNAPFTIV